MDYTKRFDDVAEELRPLAEAVAAAETQHAAIRDRLQNAEREVARLDKALEAHRRRGVERLAGSTDDVQRFEGRHRRLSRERESAASTVALLKSDTLPRAAATLASARGELAAALKALAAGAHRDAETAIHELLSQALDERDSFQVAVEALFAEYAAAWGGGGGRPRSKSVRLPPLAALERVRRQVQAPPGPDNRGLRAAESTDAAEGDSQGLPAEKSAD